MRLTKEETLATLQACGIEHECEICPIADTEKRTGYCVNIMATNALHYLKEKEPAPAATGTSLENNISQLNDTAKLKICQDALLNIGDRIAECADGDDYILGYVNALLAVLDVIGLKAGEHND